MGFRSQNYCTVWEVTPVSDTNTKARISSSRKNKQTGEYETDFSGFVNFIGTATAQKALGLKEKDRIRLGDVDVTTRYDKDKKVTYTNFKIFSFESQGEPGNGAHGDDVAAVQDAVGDGEIDDSRLPF